MAQITGAQMRAARALLNITAQDLASGTMLGVATVRRAEGQRGAGALTAANAERIVHFFRSRGVVLVPANVPEGQGEGVRFADPEAATGD